MQNEGLQFARMLKLEIIFLLLEKLGVGWLLMIRILLSVE